MPAVAEALQALFHVGEALQAVVAVHDRLLPLGAQLGLRRGDGVVERLAGDLLEVLVAPHGGEAKGELQLLLPPDLGDPPGIGAQVPRQLLVDGDGIDQSAVHVEDERLWSWHGCSPVGIGGLRRGSLELASRPRTSGGVTSRKLRGKPGWAPGDPVGDFTARWGNPVRPPEPRLQRHRRILRPPPAACVGEGHPDGLVPVPPLLTPDEGAVADAGRPGS